MDFDGPSPQIEASMNKPSLPPDFKHRPPLPDTQLAEILKKLRPKEQAPKIIPMPQPGQNLMDILRQELPTLGYPETHFLKRSINSKFVPKALVSGTDRDTNSEIDHKYKLLGYTEHETMIEHGLDPSQDRDLVTYVAEFDLQDENRGMESDDHSFSILIYAPDALEYIKPASYKSNSSYNGFAMFKDRRLIQPSLLAVVTSIPEAELPKKL